jgi:hypothetical protein
MSALWHHEQHRLALANVGFGDGHHDAVRMSKSAPCSPMKAQARPHDPLGGLLAGFETNGSGQREANDFHVVHKVPVGDSPYVRAKHVQVGQHLGFLSPSVLAVVKERCWDVCVSCLCTASRLMNVFRQSVSLVKILKTIFIVKKCCLRARSSLSFSLHKALPWMQGKIDA